MVMGDDSCSRVVGSNPGTVYWMDIFHIYLLQNCNVCLKRPKINEKEAGVGPLKKERKIHVRDVRKKVEGRVST